LCSAIISDTLLFRSPTCTEVDRVAAAKLATIAGINLEHFAQEMFTASSNFASKTPDQIFHQDFKEFVMGDYKVGIGQINSMNKKELDSMKPKMKEYLPQALGQHGVNLVLFMMTSIMDESSDLLMAGSGVEEVVEKAFGLTPQDGEVTIPGMVSRKKQMVPALTLVLQN
jgi:manganese-dependent inorganic pyrophosphatase